MILLEQVDGSVWAVGTARSGESLQEGYCRQRGEGSPLCERLEGGAAPTVPAERSERT